MPFLIQHMQITFTFHCYPTRYWLLETMDGTTSAELPAFPLLAAAIFDHKEVYAQAHGFHVE